MSDEHVWEHKCISVWRGAGTCLCVGCIICDNCKYLDVKLCIFIIWRPTYIWINIAQLHRDFTCHNKLMRSDTNGKNWLTVIGNVGHNSTLACAEMILALFKATGSHAWLPHWFQTRRRRTARVYQPIILSKIAIDTKNVATSVLMSLMTYCEGWLGTCCGNYCCSGIRVGANAKDRITQRHHYH